MSASVHGHDVIELIGNAPQPLTREQVCEALTQQHGEGVTFHACSGGGMNIDQVLKFLLQRGKIVQHENGTLTADMSLMCEHD